MVLDQGLVGRTDIRRILIIKWSAMGDVVMATAVMEDIYRAFPASRIDLNTMPSMLGLFEHDPRFHEVFAIDVRRKGSRLQNGVAWLKRIRAGDYDLVVDLQRSDHSRAMLSILQMAGQGIRYRIGNWGGIPYTIRPHPVPRDAHPFDMMRAAISAAGVPTVTCHPVLHTGVTNVERVGTLLRSNELVPGQFAMLLPGSQAAGWLKRWGWENYVELAHRLHDGGIEKIVLVGGLDELEECGSIAQQCGEWLVNLAGKTQILDVVSIAEAACLIVANDTGTAHISAAADTPMIVLCGPTNPGRVMPVGRNVVALQAGTGCINCYAKFCRLSNQECMSALKPEVVTALGLELSGRVKPFRSKAVAPILVWQRSHEDFRLAARPL